MSSRWGLGPVFTYEWLRTARRWQVYALRSLFVALLLFGLGVIWVTEAADNPSLSIAGQARVGQFCFRTIVIIQMALVMLAGPAATAGSICLDKSRGALTHLLVTDLNDAEIVLGKLAARLVPVVGLIACTLPVTALGTLMGGIDPVALNGAFAATFGLAVFGCALALTLSVWGKKTSEVLLATYAVWLVLVLGGPVWAMFGFSLGWGWNQPDWLDRINPVVMVIGPTYWPNRFRTADQWLFGLEALGASAVLTVVAVARVRAVTVRQFGQAERRKRRFGLVVPLWDRLPGPSLDGNPVLWREWRRNRASGWVRAIWALYVVAAVACSLLSLVGAPSGSRPNRDSAAVFNGLQVIIGLLMLSVSAANSLAEERVRGSLDVLLATPLPTSTIVLGKWWGAFRGVPLLAVLPYWIALALATNTGHYPGASVVAALILAYGAALTSLGLALATWFQRPGRATAACVSVYTLVTIGAVPLAMAFFHHDRVIGAGLAMASPFWGTGFFSAMIGGTGGPDADYPALAVWAVFWVIAYALVAAGLLAATLATFDRCFGRMDGLEFIPPPRRPRTPRPEPESLAIAD